MSERRYVLGYTVNVEHQNTEDKKQDLFEEECQIYNIFRENIKASNMTDSKDVVRFDTLFTFDKNEDNEYKLIQITSLM